MNIFYNVMYSCDQSWIFSIITPVFSHIILQKSFYKCLFAAQETFIFLINCFNIEKKLENNGLSRLFENFEKRFKGLEVWSFIGLYG